MKPNPQPRYLPPSTPQNVLENLKRAYTSRDSTGYDSLFDAAYVGTSAELSPPPGAVLAFSRADEALHIRALARTTTIVSVEMTFPPMAARFTDPADTMGWATIDLIPMQVVINDTPNSYVTRPFGSLTEFKFRPTLDSASPTDTTWKIVRWTEIMD